MVYACAFPVIRSDTKKEEVRIYNLRRNIYMKRSLLSLLAMLLPLLTWGNENDRTVLQSSFVSCQVASPDIPQQYAVLDNGKMTLYYDTEMSHRSGIILLHQDDWSNYVDQITECVIDPSFANLTLESMSGFFRGLSQLKSIEGLENLNTTNVREMRGMFADCSSLTSLDLSGFKTDNVTDMGGMFYGCSGLMSLDLSNFNTVNVRFMDLMFADCSSLTSLDLSNFNTVNVRFMTWMFGDCSSLTSLNLSSFKTDNVLDMYGMFINCSNLTSLDVSIFKTDNVMNMCGMFGNCSSLTSLDLSGFKTDNVTNMYWMFFKCSNLKSLDLSGFKTDNVTNMGWMFGGCSSLTSLNISSFKTDNVTNMYSMFLNCSVTSLDLSSFKTDNVSDMEDMFWGCQSLTTIYASERWNMSNVETSDNMFGQCYKLTGGAGTTWDYNHTGADYAHIDEEPDNPGYFTYKAPPTGIRYIYKDKQNVKRYTIDGKQTTNSRKGLNIVRMSNGQTRKMVVR